MSSKSIWAPRPGSFGAWTRPSRSTVMSSARPYFCIASGSSTSKKLSVPDRHDHMQIGDVVQRVAAMMHLVIHPKRLGEMGRLNQCCDPALDCDVAAKDVGRLVHDPRSVHVEPADRELSCHDRNIELLLELDVTVDVLLDKWVLVPIEAERLGDPADAQGLLKTIAPGRIEHDPVIVADRFAHRFANL